MSLVNGLKIKIAIVCAIAAAALAMLFVQQQTVKQLRQENEALKAQAAQAAQAQQAQAAQDAASAGGAAAAADEQSHEVARLRNEVAKLRKSTNDLNRSKAEMQTRNQRLESAAEASKTAVVEAQAAERQRAQNVNTCINFLRVLDSAKQQWALENKLAATNVPTINDLAPYLNKDQNGNLPACPDGGTYTIGAVNEKPACNIAGHVLP